MGGRDVFGSPHRLGPDALLLQRHARHLPDVPRRDGLLGEELTDRALVAVASDGEILLAAAVPLHRGPPVIVPSGNVVTVVGRVVAERIMVMPGRASMAPQPETVPAVVVKPPTDGQHQ